ncbi:hypothetical protein KKHLCK_10380 [Candidatus Electrothrix laxa]
MNNRYLHSLCVVMLPTAFMLIFGGIFFFPQWNTVIVQLHIEADQADNMTVFWPNCAGRYAEERSRRVGYPAGKSEHELAVSAHRARFPLRFDPGEQKHMFTLHGISVQRFGRTTTLIGKEIGSYIRGMNGVEKGTGAGKEEFLLMSADPQIYFARLPYPLPPRKNIITLCLLIPVMLFSLVIAGRRIWIAPLEELIRCVAASLVGILICGLIGEGLLYCQLIISVLYAIVLVCGCMMFFMQCRRGRRKRLGAFFLISVYSAILWVPLSRTLTHDFIQPDQGKIQVPQEDERETHSIIEIFRNALETNFIRYFSFRKQLLDLNARFKISVLGFSATSKAILGRNGMFFEGYGKRRVEGDIVRAFDNITDYMGQTPFTPAELEAWRVCLEERYYWLKEQGIDYVFALAPTKALVYPENLPLRILWTKRRADRPMRYDQLTRYLKENAVVPVADLRESLLKAKQSTDLPLFYRTDFHWNYYGAFIAYQEIIRTINRYYPEHDLDPAAYTDFTVQRKDDWVHTKFMFVLGLDPMRNQNETYLTFFPEADGPYAHIPNFMQKGISDYSLPEMVRRQYGEKSFAVREIENPVGKLPLMFIIGDSFIEKTIGYFSAHARETVNFREVTNFQTAPYQEHKPDIVVQEILNMYILQGPPVNPLQIKEARKRAMQVSFDKSLN